MPHTLQNNQHEGGVDVEQRLSKVENEVAELKAHLNYTISDVKELKTDVKTTEAAIVTQATELAVTKADIREIRDFMVKSDTRSQGNTKLLITTLISTITMLITLFVSIYVATL